MTVPYVCVPVIPPPGCRVSQACRTRVARVSPYQVEAVGALKLHVFEAIFANPEFRLLPVILGERGKIPGVDLKVADVDLVHVLHFCDLGGGGHT